MLILFLRLSARRKSAYGEAKCNIAMWFLRCLPLRVVALGQPVIRFVLWRRGRFVDKLAHPPKVVLHFGWRCARIRKFDRVASGAKGRDLLRTFPGYVQAAETWQTVKQLPNYEAVVGELLFRQ